MPVNIQLLAHHHAQIAPLVSQVLQVVLHVRIVQQELYLLQREVLVHHALQATILIQELPHVLSAHQVIIVQTQMHHPSDAEVAIILEQVNHLALVSFSHLTVLIIFCSLHGRKCLSRRNKCSIILWSRIFYKCNHKGLYRMPSRLFLSRWYYSDSVFCRYLCL